MRISIRDDADQALFLETRRPTALRAACIGDAQGWTIRMKNQLPGSKTATQPSQPPPFAPSGTKTWLFFSLTA
ncbi:hypothetical protein QNM99_19835, partial [Pseudomonas sp. PCH446]